MGDSPADIIRLFGDKGGKALERWVDRLGPHLQERTVVEPVRHNRMPAPPWPERDNPMLGYLIDRARDIVKDEGLDSALVWLAAHAWFEGAVEERYRMVTAAVTPDHSGNAEEQ